MHVLGGTLMWGQRHVMSLDEMFALADSLNSTIKVSNLAVSEAEAGEEVARNAYLPSIEASVSASYNGDGYIMDRNWHTCKVLGLAIYLAYSIHEER